MPGLENAKCENYEEAFTCFLEAAQLGYHKAQFNTGVCYEKGRGVSQDWEKVRFNYIVWPLWTTMSKLPFVSSLQGNPLLPTGRS